VGRRGPVRTADLWRVFFTHLPVWVVVFSVTSLTLMLAANLVPLVQLLVCLPAGVLAGAMLILISGPQRRVAAHLLASIGELKRATYA
jgi:hypothetical protein